MITGFLFCFVFCTPGICATVLQDSGFHLNCSRAVTLFLGNMLVLMIPMTVQFPEPLQCYSGLLHLCYSEITLKTWVVFRREVSILKPFSMFILVRFMCG